MSKNESYSTFFENFVKSSYEEKCEIITELERVRAKMILSGYKPVEAEPAPAKVVETKTVEEKSDGIISDNIDIKVRKKYNTKASRAKSIKCENAAEIINPYSKNKDAEWHSYNVLLSAILHRANHYYSATKEHKEIMKDYDSAANIILSFRQHDLSTYSVEYKTANKMAKKNPAKYFMHKAVSMNKRKAAKDSSFVGEYKEMIRRYNEYVSLEKKYKRYISK